MGNRNNALNLVRVILASAVLIAHSYPLTGHPGGAQLGSLNLGTWAVAGFFCLSGYLIAGSRVRTKWWPYIWRRSLRIFPALIAAVAVTAFVFAPLASALGQGPWHLGAALRYIVKNVTLYRLQYEIASTLSTAPYPDAWNGSLWTLFYELAAYLVLGLLLTVGVIRRKPTATFAALLPVCTVAADLARAHIHSGYFKYAFFLGAYFLAGSLIWAIRDRVPLTAPLGLAACAATVVIGGLQPADSVWVALPLAYALLWLGSAVPFHVFSNNDISYGMYVYAFPVQQLFTVATGNRNPYVLMLGAWPLTAVLAFASWRLIEKPAMKLRSLVQ